MKIALISDLHGNIPALMALEKDLMAQKPDQIWCLGDLVGKGPSSPQTFDWAVKHCNIILGGNWDYGVGGKEFLRDSFYWEQLGEQRLAVLKSLPREKTLHLSGRKIRLFHGRPVMERLLNIQDPKEALLPLLEPDFDMLIYADTHRQGARTLAGQVINIGSVGNSLGLPLVQYAILEGEKSETKGRLEVRFITLPYDNQKAADDALSHTGLPDAQAYVQEVLTGVYAGYLRVRSERARMT